ncbi:hypothetical protein ABBQ32_010682 [Trebouxia sp. C0010 RCD-2024]
MTLINHMPFLALCGQDPETALNSALTSVNFYLQQQQLYFEFREAQLQKKMNKVQEACKKKLQEVHTGYTAAKRKYHEVLAVKQQLDGDNQELQQKYSQKAMQARKLQEMFQKVQQENEMLRSGRRPAPQAPLPGSGPHFNSLLSPPHNVRHQHNTPGSGRVVTTVQHKQMFVPNRQLPSPNVGTLDGGGQFAAAPPGGFLGSKRAGAMQQAVSRQARQGFEAGGAGGGMRGLAFDQPSPSGLQLAGQLSPLQESSFTPHRTQPKNSLRQLLGNTGIGGSGAGFGGGVGTARKAAFMGQARGSSPSGIASL